VKVGVLNNPEFDEPIDAMIYMIISALGFAAGENILVLSPLKSPFFGQIFEISLLRFLGATFLHALASGTIGFFIGLSLRPRRKEWRLIFVGLILAVLLHGFYNFSIMRIEKSFKLLIPSFLLITSAIIVSFCFKKLKSMCKVSV
jgi:RsiW-degrading membrane proteinase PrsW (M82 family)